MKTYYEVRSLIKKFCEDNKLSVSDVAGISKQMSRCVMCKFFVQHFTSDGTPVDFGHCSRGNIPRPKKPNTESCAFWESEEYWLND